MRSSSLKVEENLTPTEVDGSLLCSTEMEIQGKNGTAIISGTACSAEEIVQAENAVNSMSGVERVLTG